MITPESCRFKFQAQELPQRLRQIAQELPTSYWLFEFPELSGIAGKKAWHLVLSRSQVVFSGNQQFSWQWFLECFRRYIPRFRGELVRSAILQLEQQLPLEEPENLSALLFDRLNQLYQLNLISPNESRQALWLSLLVDCDNYLFDRAGYADFMPLPMPEIQPLIAGFDLEKVLATAKERQIEWYKLQSLISSMESFPMLNAQAVSATTLNFAQQQRLQALVAERKTLNDISAELGQDPLETAKLFAQLVSKQLVTLTSLQAGTSYEIFVVDDSQILLRRFENLVTSWGMSISMISGRDIPILVTWSGCRYRR
ncbi:hypothetical protein [Leptolyngbya sp. 7M]|uniref:hypothetical protein n=1 Tax=Leptolyngbya sp. 7M TaxID=2812896 RepID=UPI001B8C7A9F|nr:hypothetical protein [Leptolyngbya sp. 7M]QYO63066.1 hypothetical protein JVX88_24285 [Leptolyngbya sp. 7M]